MLKKSLSLALVALVIELACATTASAAQTKKETRFAEKVKAEVAKLGTGPRARVNVKLRDGSAVRGYVTETKDDEFVAVDEKTTTAMRVPYSEIKRITGNNVSTGAKLSLSSKKTSSPFIWLAVIAGVVVIAVAGASASR